jgi:hypothetical protein
MRAADDFGAVRARLAQIKEVGKRVEAHNVAHVLRVVNEWNAAYGNGSGAGCGLLSVSDFILSTLIKREMEILTRRGLIPKPPNE